MNPIAKATLYIVGAIVALAALITAGLYDWSNKDPGETDLRPASAESRNA